jgi:putative DNA primase/helicase
MRTRRKRSIEINLSAVADDEASGEFLAVIKFCDIDGKTREATLPLSDLDDLKTLRKTLRNAGCYFSRKEAKTRAALARLGKSTGRVTRLKIAARTGWYNHRRQFVHPDCVIGRRYGRRLFKTPRLTYSQNHNSNLKIQGFHKRWIKGVAEPAQNSSRLVLGICMALAAPLIGFADLNSFGVLVHGPGKAGKSTLLVAAGSVVGFASERDLPNFRTTDAALGEIPAAFNDMLLPMNELSLLKGHNAERSERIRDFSYGLAEGRGTTYSKLAPINVAERIWRCIVLASGEEASEQISEAAGHTRAIGAAIRWIDLCATRGGAEDIFDFCPDEIIEENRKAWVRQQCVALRESCRAHHGVAFKHFIRHVIKCRRTIRPHLRGLMDQFIKKVSSKGDHPAVGHLATCFALIAAAGRLGVRFGTLPWTERFVIRCIKRCYRDARREVRTESDLLYEGLRILEDGVRSKLVKVSPKKPYLKSAWKAADGYREKTNFGTKVTIRGEAFKGWFADRRQPAIVLRWLYSKNALCSKRGPSGSSAPAITWAESQPLWPDGSRPRSIILELRPGELSDSKK